MFLLVVLAGLGVYAVRLNTLQQQTVTAGLAGRAGVRGRAHRRRVGRLSALNGGGCGTSTLNLTEGAAAGFRVAVQCTSARIRKARATIRVFVFDVRAEAGVYGGPDYVSRRVQTKITDAV